MKVFLKNYLFLMIISSVVLTDVVLWHFDFSPSDWIEYTYNGTIVALIVCEFLAPRNPAWSYINRKEIKFREIAVEIFFYFWSGFFAVAITYSFSKWSADQLRSYLDITFKIPLPWILQAVIIVLLIDFLRYWLHRWMHVNPFLWRFHALHHMPERLGTATSIRTHPIDDFILYVPEAFLLFFLGFDRTIVAALYTVIWVISLIKHANIEIAEDRFSKHFQLPRYHLLHHNYQSEEARTYNFSEILTFWDKVFGTFKGDSVSDSHRVGVSSAEPRGFFREFFGWIFLPIQKM